MANKKIEIDVVLKTANAANSIKAIKKALEELGEASQQVGNTSEEMEKLAEATDKLNNNLKETGNASKGLDKVSKSGDGIVGSFKKIAAATGIFAILQKVLGDLQPVLDLIDTTFTAVSIVINQVVDAIEKAFESTNEATGGFDALQKVGSALITLVLTPFKLIFYQIKTAIQLAQLAWEKSFFGDEKKAKILEANLAETGKAVKNVINEAGDAVVSIGENIVEAVGEVGEFASAVGNELSKISITDAISMANRITNLKKAAEIAEAVNAKLLKQYEIVAEKQRQIRDNDTNSIEDRIKANDELGLTLEKEAKILSENANLAIQVAQLNVKANDNQANKIALINAETKKVEILADIEGKKSEQLQNNVTLSKELIVLNNTASDGEIKRATKQRQANADLIGDELAKLKLLKDNLVIEQEIELLRLKKVIDSAKVGTQARADAEQAYLDAKQDFANRGAAIDKNITDTTKANELKRISEKTKSDETLLSQGLAKLGIQEQAKFLLQSKFLTDARAERIKNAKTTGEDVAKINAEFDLKDAELGEANKKRKMKLAADIAQGVADVTSTITSAVDEKNKEKLDAELNANKEVLDGKLFDLEAAKNKELAKEGLTANEKTAINNKFAAQEFKLKTDAFQKDEVLKKKAFETNKKLAFANAIVNGATAIITSLAAAPLAIVAAPNPAGIIALTTVVAATAASLAKISSSKYEGGTAPTAPQVSIPSGGDGGEGSTPSNPRLNDFSLFGTAGTKNQGGTAQNQPQVIRAYVSETEISETSARVSKFQTASEL